MEGECGLSSDYELLPAGQAHILGSPNDSLFRQNPQAG